MKNKEFYIEQAESLRDEIITTMNKDIDGLSPENVTNPYPEMQDIILRFVHLVYSFDDRLPLNEHIREINRFRFLPLSFGKDYTVVEFEKTLYFVNFFITYLKEYT